MQQNYSQSQHMHPRKRQIIYSCPSPLCTDSACRMGEQCRECLYLSIIIYHDHVCCVINQNLTFQLFLFKILLKLEIKYIYKQKSRK
jgi:hypothetical protein